MSDARAANGASGNLFLDNLPAGAKATLAASFTTSKLKNAQIVYDTDDAINNVLFPISSIVSVVVIMSNGGTAEVGIIGREGMTGLALALGQKRANERSIVQVPDSAISISAEAFSAALQSDPELKTYCLRYAQAVLMMAEHLSACNSLHPVNERCARWLIMAHDRVDGNLLLLTQEFLSQMLGLTRGSVTLAASTLQEAGFISYSRGHITIKNRLGLENATCECYGTISRYWKNLMGYTISKSHQVEIETSSSLDGSTR